MVTTDDRRVSFAVRYVPRESRVVVSAGSMSYSFLPDWFNRPLAPTSTPLDDAGAKRRKLF